jgi:chromosome segregation protein
VLRERLHALELTDPSRLSAALSDRPPVKASVFGHGSHPGNVPVVGLPLSSKIHVSDPVVAGAVADWLAGAWRSKARRMRACARRLPPGCVMVNREGHQFTRHTVSFHAPDAEDAGLLARQAENRGAGEALRRARHQAGGGRGRAAAPRGRPAGAHRVARSGAARLFAAPEALHDAQIRGA